MEYILLKDVPALGKQGAVVKVARGYARNYLLPRGLAVPATAKSKAAGAAEVARAEKRRARLRQEANAIASRMANVALSFAKLANDGGDLYGSVAPAEVAEALAAQGFAVDKNQVSFDEPVTRLGLYAALVKLAEGVEVAVPVTVVRPAE